MLRILTLAFSGLYVASGERVPEEFLEIFGDHMSDYANHEVIQKRHDRFASLGLTCHTLLESCVSDLRSHSIGCEHVVGVIFALADAWVTAYERDEAREAHNAAAAEWGKTGISPSVAQSLDEALGVGDT